MLGLIGTELKSCIIPDSEDEGWSSPSWLLCSQRSKSQQRERDEVKKTKREKKEADI